MTRAAASALILAALLPATAAAQAAKGPAVRIDFRALGENGDQVPDLKAEDISLKVNGKARQVQSLSLFRTTGEGAATGSGVDRRRRHRGL